MRRNIAEPGNTRGFEGNVWIKAAGDSLMDDSLFLLVEQDNHPLLYSNVAVDLAVGVVEEADDGVLFLKSWNGHS